MAIMATGISASTLLGAVIGIWSKTQMMATSIALPVMMFFSFLPMLSFFNETIAKIAKIIYTEQISRMLNQIKALQLGRDSIFIIIANVVLFAALFAIAYRKCGLE